MSRSDQLGLQKTEGSRKGKWKNNGRKARKDRQGVKASRRDRCFAFEATIRGKGMDWGPVEVKQ